MSEKYSTIPKKLFNLKKLQNIQVDLEKNQNDINKIDKKNLNLLGRYFTENKLKEMLSEVDKKNSSSNLLIGILTDLHKKYLNVLEIKLMIRISGYIEKLYLFQSQKNAVPGDLYSKDHSLYSILHVYFKKSEKFSTLIKQLKILNNSEILEKTQIIKNWVDNDSVGNILPARDFVDRVETLFKYSNSTTKHSEISTLHKKWLKDHFADNQKLQNLLAKYSKVVDTKLGEKITKIYDWYNNSLIKIEHKQTVKTVQKRVELLLEFIKIGGIPTNLKAYNQILFNWYRNNFSKSAYPGFIEEFKNQPTDELKLKIELVKQKMDDLINTSNKSYNEMIKTKMKLSELKNLLPNEPKENGINQENLKKHIFSNDNFKDWFKKQFNDENYQNLLIMTQKFDVSSDGLSLNLNLDFDLLEALFNLHKEAFGKRLNFKQNFEALKLRKLKCKQTGKNLVLTQKEKIFIYPYKTKLNEKNTQDRYKKIRQGLIKKYGENYIDEFLKFSRKID